VVVCVVLAVVSVHALPTVPIYDEFSWLVWGREIAHQFIAPHQALNFLGGPSWKPLPVLATTIFGFFGSSAVTLWMVFVRTVGLLALYFAYKVGSRLGATERWRLAAPAAGVLTAAAVVLTQSWFHFMFRATSEPLTITAALLWIDRELAGRRLQALAAGMALACMRPEAGAFLALYAVWCLWRERGIVRRLIVVAGVIIVPLAWIVPPWIADGMPLQAATRARKFEGNRGHDVATVVLSRSAHLTIAPVMVAAAVMLGLAAWRREGVVFVLAAVSVAYLGVIELMTLHGFPGLPRFLLPAAAIVCVLAGAAVARVAALAGGGVASAAILVALVALSSPFCVPRVTRVRSERHLAAVALHSRNTLVAAVRRAGGRARVLPCATSSAAVNHVVATSLAWTLDVPLTRVHAVTSRPGSVRVPTVTFLAHPNPAVGRIPTHLHPWLREHLLARDAPWRVMRITGRRVHRADACVGT
jgi:hypothetical protein